MLTLAFTRLGGGTLTGPAGFGKPTLVVNTASECGYTPQYAELQQLWEEYHERGLVVLGVPCNDFGAQLVGAWPSSVSPLSNEIVEAIEAVLD